MFLPPSRSPFFWAVRKFRTTEFSSNSPSSKMCLMCSEMFDLLMGQPKVPADQLGFDLCSVRFGVINDDCNKNILVTCQERLIDQIIAPRVGQIRTISDLVPLNPRFSTSGQRCSYEGSRFCFALDYPATGYIWDSCLGFVLGSGIPSLGFGRLRSRPLRRSRIGPPTRCRCSSHTPQRRMRPVQK